MQPPVGGYTSQISSVSAPECSTTGRRTYWASQKVIPMSTLRKAHFYRRVPKELTEGNALGGVVSLVGIVCSAFLVYSNAASYLTTAVRTKLVLDLNTEDHIELAFNITMEGLPCRFTAIDFFDVTGTKRLNISRDIMKVRVSSTDGHILGMGEEEEWISDVEHDDPEEAHELASLIAEEAEGDEEDVPMLTGSTKDRDTKERRHFNSFVNRWWVVHTMGAHRPSQHFAPRLVRVRDP